VKLFVLPDGHAIIEVPEGLEMSHVQNIQERWKAWREERASLLIVPGVVEFRDELIDGDLLIERAG
jgi:hypothetical protein